LEALVGKIIFALLTAAIAWVLFKGLSKGLKKPPRSDAGRRDAARSGHDKAKNLNAPERMVKCVRCGVFMPETESVIVDGVDGQISCRDPNTCAHGRADGG
jgi:hypothetical protein